MTAAFSTFIVLTDCKSGSRLQPKAVKQRDVPIMSHVLLNQEGELYLK